MNYTILGDNDYLFNPIDSIFKSRGVNNKNLILNLDESCCHNYKLLSNIDIAVDKLIEHINKGSKVFVQADPDCDGYSSTSILINYINKTFDNVELIWELPTGKQHGVKVKNVPDDTGLVIIPDSGSNQFEEHKALKEKGIDVIVLDHHICEKESEDAIVVNNQLSPLYPNKNLSGAGIVYKFCVALDDRLGLQNADNYLDLLAVGNIGDMMDLREPETRYLVKKGLQSIKNPLLKEILIKQEFSMKGIVNIHNVGFFVCPLINAGIRFGSKEDKVQLMEALLESEQKVYYKKKDIYESIQVATARNLSNLRNRQNTARDKGADKIAALIEEKNLDKHSFLTVKVGEVLDKNLTGLVANNLAREHKKPVLLLREKEKGIFTGSARGYDKGGISNFREYLLNTGLFNFCEGHDNSFGVEIKSENIPLLEELLQKSEVSNTDSGIEVDFEIPYEEMNRDLVINVGEFKNEWGSTLPEPKLAYKDIAVDSSDITLIGKKKNTLKFTGNGIEFIKFFVKQEEFEVNFDLGETFYLDVIGKCSINEWNGNKTPQIEIVDYKVTDRLLF
ncbi:DHH family phosphoesterase [Bacillus sp. AG4(2022)]|uniref:DHH family phosphoesterase n=1 Tax=Bacillus sp. AG4(2022) TaxID=2962594 RepID=UPI00288174BF|nr:DHH family phosphoesterase [Bacillus sp. AG4(2022)]MDT0160438.1 DHH family phosphoesterase [Bacillus sp. AG4(2022)]